jgi:integrase
MPRTIHCLNVTSLERGAKYRRPGMYGDGGGLYLLVKHQDARSWVFRYMLDRQANAMGLGAYPDVSLSSAREEARRSREHLEQGRDPLEARKAQQAQRRAEAAKTMTFRQCAETFIEDNKDGWRNAKHAAQWTSTLETYANPLIGDLPVQAVDRELVRRILKPIWKTKTETASRVRGRIERILDWATTRDYRQGENPARWRGNLATQFPERTKVKTVRHHPALPYAELPAFMERLMAADGIASQALQFTILTTSRTNETIGALWPEIDFDKALWTVPGDRIKAKREHRVPLSRTALTLLRKRHELTGGQGFIFPGARARKPLSNMAMLALLARLERDDLTVHGFRSTFRDWVEETTNFPGSVAEAALAHVVGDKVEAAYRRGDLFEKRRRLMTAWATFCTTPAAERGKVINMKRRAANA